MDVLLAALLALPFVLFALVTWRRRARFRSLAPALGGTHTSSWPFVPGRIRGADFEIEAAKVGKSYRTLVRAAAARGTPGTFLLKPEFFEGFPNWGSVRVRAVTRQRAFLWEVSLPGWGEPDKEQRSLLLRWLGSWPPHSGLDEKLRSAEVREIWVEDGFVSTDFRGIVTSLARLRPALEALRALSSGGQRLAAG